MPAHSARHLEIIAYLGMYCVLSASMPPVLPETWHAGGLGEAFEIALAA